MLQPIATYTLLALTLIAASAARVGAEELSPDQAKLEYRQTEQRNGWSAGTRSRPRQRPVEPGPATLFLRIYDGARSFGPVYDGRGQALGLNVTSALETCQDGNTIVRALNIGGWSYQLDAECSDFSRGTRITVSQESAGVVIRQSNNERLEPGEATIIRCEAASWTCRTEVRSSD
jgi:hypothetical protein